MFNVFYIICLYIDVRSTAADPLKASWIVSVFARACDRSGFRYLGHDNRCVLEPTPIANYATYSLTLLT